MRGVFKVSPWPGMARQGGAGLGGAWLGKAGKFSRFHHGVARQVLAGRGTARHGRAWPGAARHGQAGQGVARQGEFERVAKLARVALVG